MSNVACHFCHLTVFPKEEQERIGAFVFHRDISKRCLQKYLSQHHDEHKLIAIRRQFFPRLTR